MNSTADRWLDHFAEYGDVYDAMDACDDLEMKLSRLKRLKLMTEEEFLASRESVNEVKNLVERRIDSGE
jgi:hypothetical protein